MPHARLFSVLLLALGSGFAAAQPLMEEEDLALAYGDQNFVSIATGTRQPLSKAPSTATVITAEQIASMGAQTVSQALESVPGLHVSRNNLQNNYALTYGMRGILTGTSPHVLMMVNGIPRTSIYLGNPDEQMVELPVDNIARIEVIRGPGSAVYGADAFAGFEHDAAARGQGAHLRYDERQMRDVGIVTCILDDAGARPGLAALLAGQCEARSLTLRQQDLDRVRKFSRQEGGEGGLGRGGGASARGPAAAQRAFWLASHGAILAFGV